MYIVFLINTLPKKQNVHISVLLLFNCSKVLAGVGGGTLWSVLLGIIQDISGLKKFQSNNK